MTRRLPAIAMLLALGLMLGACDKCGDWFWSRPSGPASCKGSLPPH
jgi:hypothetical protein